MAVQIRVSKRVSRGVAPERLADSNPDWQLFADADDQNRSSETIPQRWGHPVLGVWENR